ncbi:hypothetical protein [Polycyclovorans algicola]|nr:hypothetical protein [Polycyclovorans algicola]
MHRLSGPGRVTDALAVKHGGRLVTFDERISINTAPGGAPLTT